MHLAPLLLLLVPLTLVLLQLLLRWGLQRRSELLRSTHTHRPLQRQDAPIAVEVDVDSSPLFDSPAPREALPHYLVLDTETQDILHEEEVGIEFYNRQNEASGTKGTKRTNRKRLRRNEAYA